MATLTMADLVRRQELVDLTLHISLYPYPYLEP